MMIPAALGALNYAAAAVAQRLPQVPYVAPAVVASTTPIGMNMPLEVSSYYSGLPLYINAINQGGSFQRAATNDYLSATGELDANGWPTVDVKVLLYSTQGQTTPVWPWMVGEWTVSYTGAGTVTMLTGPAITSSVYTAGTNKTVFKFTITNQPLIQFTITGVSGGAKDIDARRPGDAGKTGRFRDDALAFYGRWAYVRTMWLTGGWQDPSTTWASRRQVKPGNTGVNPNGNAQNMPMEDAIDFGLACGKDAWHCLPVNCTDDYVNGFADYLIAKGLPNASQRIYLELGNELWNGTGPAKAMLEATATAYNTANPGILDSVGGTQGAAIWGQRYSVLRTKQIRTALAAKLGTAVQYIRMVWASQAGNPGIAKDTLFWAKNSASVGAPSAFLYAYASAPYGEMKNGNFGGTDDFDTATLTVAQTLASVQLNASNTLKVAHCEAQTTLALLYGIKHIAYEGGPSLASGFAPNVLNTGLANEDPGVQAPTYTLLSQALESMESFCFFEGGNSRNGNYGSGFGLTSNYNNLVALSAPKILALKQFDAGYTPTRNIVPGNVDARQAIDRYNTGNDATYLAFNTDGYNPATPWWYPYGGQSNYITWLINVTTAGTYALTLTLNSTASFTTNVDIDGTNQITGKVLASTAGVDADRLVGNVTLTKGVHFIRLGNGTANAAVAKVLKFA